MVAAEQRYNAFQIVRPVEEGGALNRYLAAAELAGRVVFGNSDFDINGDEILSSLINEIAETDEFDDQSGPLTLNIGVAKHDIYSRHGLKFLLLDKRAPANLKAQPLLRAYMRFKRQPDERAVPLRGRTPAKIVPPAMPNQALRQAALRYDIPDSSEIRVEFDAVVPVVDPTATRRGTELALLPKRVQPEALLLHDEAEICLAAFSAVYPNLAYPATKTVGQVSFGRMPADASVEQQVRYIDFLERKLGSGLGLVLGAPEPRLQT